MLQLRRWQEKTQKPKNSSLRSGRVPGARGRLAAAPLSSIKLHCKPEASKHRGGSTGKVEAWAVDVCFSRLTMARLHMGRALAIFEL